MIPAGLPSTAVSPPAARVVSPSAPSPPTARPGRLRGLSYLRHYAHGVHHHHHQSSPSLAAPAVLTTATAPTSPFPSTGLSRPPAHAVPSSASSTSSSSQALPQRRTTSPLSNSATNSWIPTVSGISGLSRVASTPSAELSTSSVHATNVSASDRHAAPKVSGSSVVRSIDETILPPERSSAAYHHPLPTRSVSTSALMAPSNDLQPAASIRFCPHTDVRASRESLQFSPIERVLRHKDERIRVGRYSDRDAQNPAAPVGFKSKVVSRRHCEFWCDNGQWYVKDVKSSSGTFLNHVRLSPAGAESKQFPVNDGDIIQLGIDFKGGEEQIFRCVKIRLELNRAWQKGLNNFNMSAHRRLRNMAKGKDADSMSTNSSECAICLLSVSPCQALFVAPCSHVWHYKCIRPLLDREFPNFLCPNCRAHADLDRDIEENEFPEEFGEELWEQIPDEILHEGRDTLGKVDTAQGEAGNVPAAGCAKSIYESPLAPYIPLSEGASSEAVRAPPLDPSAVRATSSGSWRRRRDTIHELDIHELEIRSPATTNGNTAEEAGEGTSDSGSGSNSDGGGAGHDHGPMTPMNDAGPFLLDGRGNSYPQQTAEA